MLLPHASSSFPGEWLPAFELVLLAVAVLLALAKPNLGRRGIGRAWRTLRRLGRRPGRAILLAGALGAGGTAAVSLGLGMPEPKVADEFSYLLAADTFAHGRVTNPSHPMWIHFESLHVLQQPTYMAKYPPAQGLVLGLGQAVGGHPGVGLWISAGLLAAAVCWMLFAWLPAPWAIVGTVLVILRLGVGSYWQQSYWGGAMAAVGGALLFGALRRVVNRPRVGDSVWLAVGVALLANSRPWEGLLVAAPAAVLLLGWLMSARRPSWKTVLVRLLVPGLGALGLAAGAMAHYNARVTGDPLRMPYQHYEETYSMRPLFLWQDLRPEPEYHHDAMRGFYTRRAGNVDRSTPWPLLGLRKGWARFSLGAVFLLGSSLTLAALAALPAVRRDRWLALALLVWALLAAGHCLIFSWWAHYSAPIAALAVTVAMTGLRRVGGWCRRRGGRLLVGAVVLINLALFVVQIPAHRPDPEDWSLRRARIVRELQRQGGKHLVVVRRTMTASGWIYNRADLDTADVLWAHDMGEERNRELLAYYRDREHWLLDGFEPIPYPDTRPTARPSSSALLW